MKSLKISLIAVALMMTTQFAHAGVAGICDKNKENCKDLQGNPITIPKMETKEKAFLPVTKATKPSCSINRRENYQRSGC